MHAICFDKHKLTPLLSLNQSAVLAAFWGRQRQSAECCEERRVPCPVVGKLLLPLAHEVLSQSEGLLAGLVQSSAPTVLRQLHAQYNLLHVAALRARARLEVGEGRVRRQSLLTACARRSHLALRKRDVSVQVSHGQRQLQLGRTTRALCGGNASTPLCADPFLLSRCPQ